MCLLYGTSGCAGLAYETVWIRAFTISFGSTLLSFSTVISVYLGGLALGAAGAGRLQTRSGLAWYGAAEIFIGLYAFGDPAADGTVNGVACSALCIKRGGSTVRHARAPVCRDSDRPVPTSQDGIPAYGDGGQRPRYRCRFGVVVVIAKRNVSWAHLDGEQTARRSQKTLQSPGSLNFAAQAEEIIEEGPLAQRLEQRTHNPLVVGSNPTGPTTGRMSGLAVFL